MQDEIHAFITDNIDVEYIMEEAVEVLEDYYLKNPDKFKKDKETGTLAYIKISVDTE